MNQKPIKEFKAGLVHATVWPERVKRDGRSWDAFSIQIQKVYRNPSDGQYRTTSYFRPDELPKLVLAANEAYAFVTLKQQTSAGENTDDGASNPAAADQRKEEAP